MACYVAERPTSMPQIGCNHKDVMLAQVSLLIPTLEANECYTN